MTERITHHKILGEYHPNMVSFQWNGRTYFGAEGESVTAALLANDIRTIRRHERDGSPRGLYCNIGHCSECRCTVDNVPNQRACLTKLKEGMDITLQNEVPHLVKGDN